MHLTYDIQLKLLYATLKKIKVAPVVELVNHWLHSIKTSTAIMCTSLIARLAASVDPHTDTIINITTPCIMINESVGAKVVLQTQRANTRFNVKACQPI